MIEKKEKLGTRWLKCCKTPDKQTQFRVTDVDEGCEVQFQVRAENEAGIGDPSEPTEILTIEDPTSKSGKFSVNTFTVCVCMCHFTHVGRSFIMIS